MRIERFEKHPRVRVAFSGRAEGNQASHTGLEPEQVRAARARLASELGVGPQRLSYMSQVHSARVASAPAPGAEVPEVDALLDADGGLAPVVLTADCVPVALAGRAGERTVLAVAHAGRPGLLAGVLEATLGALTEQGAGELEAWIGPAICGRCYEVPEAMRADAETRVPGISARTSWDTPSLDLPGAAASILRRAGVLVHASHACTLEDRAWFSYRGGDSAPRNATLLWVDDDCASDQASPLDAEPAEEEAK
ncbi:laccase domain-containing protein [Galactobacter valiniphilus]|uniref:Laccase domain-containing protein n=1 Tax=Galactobacter valiniphilus TaxID=2676122 RepID=A0A399JBL9_9MICC|nr:polyphenol oxidase family protein [Galactobacter valiniphilus]RII42965.1 laccase domain-containing protein [Galactobacter valiniphilus]